MEQAGLLAVQVVNQYRNPLEEMRRLLTDASKAQWKPPVLNKDQQRIAANICEKYDNGDRKPCLIHGITGSGKTEVYMELISHVIRAGKQVILLIPEISLTWQTVMRFYLRFGDRVSVLNSRMSAGERFDQYERARTGDIDIIIGPRSALFVPFERLGMLIIDEEHENSYKSELSPRYDAREVARKRGEMEGAMLVLGSATPSLETYTRAVRGEYDLYKLTRRAKSRCCSAYGGNRRPAGRIKSGQPVYFQRKIKRTAGGPSGKRRTGHAIYQQTGLCHLCVLPILWGSGKMSSL